ncbi:DUF4435 domain-containing protein [Pectobacterium versatile]|uniref:DUF4435 domain-containing protein n=1 Tax=Pectobacterium versatile TaxID=2488639 RepID=UPI0019691F0B|nr:DUF4435 domain-containing protein [Pectobacterium versatile]MBN3238337.1 DUF4435 domain-containing protein [Pectobacterium versatile]
MSKGLVRSSKALSVINKFSRASLTIYVEGPTDRVFWKTLFEINAIENVSIHIAGSCTILDEYINSIINDDVGIFVARDKDYKYHTAQLPEHTRVIFTYGHSIENSLIYKNALTDIGVSYGGEMAQCNEYYSEWKKETTDILYELVLREFANEMSEKRISVLGDHCDRFLGKRKNTDRMPIEIVNDLISKIDENFSPDILLKAKEICTQLGDDIYWFIRGHFIFSLAIRFIKKLIKKIENKEPLIPNDFLFSLLISQFRFNIITKKHPHKEHYDLQIGKISNYLSA